MNGKCGVIGGAIIFGLLAAAGPILAQAGPAADEPRFGRSTPTDGKGLFEAKCSLCHAGFAPGTISLGQRLGKDRAVLTDRTDLDASYVTAVVRSGLGTMPPFTRVDLNDEQLAKVAAYLSAPKRKGRAE